MLNRSQSRNSENQTTMSRKRKFKRKLKNALSTLLLPQHTLASPKKKPANGDANVAEEDADSASPQSDLISNNHGSNYAHFDFKVRVALNFRFISRSLTVPPTSSMDLCNRPRLRRLLQNWIESRTRVLPKSCVTRPISGLDSLIAAMSTVHPSAFVEFVCNSAAGRR